MTSTKQQQAEQLSTAGKALSDYVDGFIATNTESKSPPDFPAIEEFLGKLQDLVTQGCSKEDCQTLLQKWSQNVTEKAKEEEDKKLIQDLAHSLPKEHPLKGLLTPKPKPSS